MRAKTELSEQEFVRHCEYRIPYIPPPPRPPAPPRIFTPPPPRIPAHNHFQNQQRVHQQQQFHHQQQQRLQQQHLQQQRFHQNIIAENQRRHQQQQQLQQLQRQQQAMEFQRQQEQQRQEQLRNQQRHQDFLKNYQKSSGLNGATVVNIAPEIRIESEGNSVPLGECITTQVEVSVGQQQAPPPSAPPQGSVGPTAAAMAQATGNNLSLVSNGQPHDTPPPYSPSEASPTTQQSPPVQAAATMPRPELKEPPRNTIALKDGSIIVLKAEDEILFRGPRGVEMVVNCLPLYTPVPELQSGGENPTVKENQGDSDEKLSPRKSFSLIKARSTNALDIVAAELELHDNDTEMNKSQEALSGTVVSLPPRSWSKSHAKNFTIMVHDRPHPANSSVQSGSLDNPDVVGGGAQYAAGNEAVGEAQAPNQGMTKSATAENIQALPEEEEELYELDSTTMPSKSSPPSENNGVSLSDKDLPNTEEPQPNEGSNVGGAAGSLEGDTNEEDSPKPKPGVTQENGVHEEARTEGSCNEQVKVENEVRIETPVETKTGSGATEIPSSPASVFEENSSEDSPGHDEDHLSPKTPPTARSKSPKAGKKRLRSSKSMSPTHEDNGSDEESGGQEFHLNYIDQPTMSTLKRSSGSVSFLSRQAATPILVLGAENKAKMIVEESPSQTSEESVPNTKLPIVEEALSTVAVSSSSPSALPTHETNPPNSSQSQQQATPLSLLEYSVSEILIPTPLHNPPATIDPSYIERSGWLMKLSHRKGMFGDKWQKRYFVLHRSWLYYFKKYGDSNPRGVVRLLPSGWCQPVAQGTRRMSDAVAKSEQSKIVSVLRCIAVHRPANFVASLCDLLDAEGVAETFRSTTLSVTNSQHFSRTYYMVAPSDTERESWVESITNNIRSYSHSPEALTNACKELRIMLRAVNSTLEPKLIPALLHLIHMKRRTLFPPTSQGGAQSN